ncbi:potassium transporter Kup [Silanimonas sp.]|uniref:potassium transporter Kup n=1 Tax=Silanimonas sp. TaxID=1929290 RepID=UPI0022C18E1F|nr:potassium transporter Kup [Silanimonas sp.]MCZ8062418.1 potassium transporter Kup [Silanimonas sp.]
MSDPNAAPVSSAPAEAACEVGTGQPAGHVHARAGTTALVVGAIGVVFGDIGTSPLYTLKEAFGHAYGLTPTPDNVLGVLSLIFWALIGVVSVKYVMVMMRADNRGEGGVLALAALVQRHLPIAAPLSYLVGVLGIFATALFFGDGVITPAISVLGAVEGLEVAAPALHPYVVPVAIAVLLVLFAFQFLGTEKVGKVFGPITCLWFAAIGVAGVGGIVENPEVLKAFNPAWAVAFFAHHGVVAWVALGAVVLAVTGGEALYADMGHFGRRAIQLGWFGFVMPCLLLNYLGQGALLLADPAAVKNPFYLLLPSWALVPMIVLATLAAVIASQALISGTYSVVRQAIQLGYLPRMKIVHTSDDTEGQIYMPSINRWLLVAVMLTVIGFGSSSALAVAYGVSVTGTMIISGILLLILARVCWRTPRWVLWTAGLAMLVVDVALFSANLVKFFEGAWFPLALGLGAFVLMRTWHRGRVLVREQVNRDSLRIEHLVKSLMASPPARVPGTAVFLTPSNAFTPPALLHNLKHNKVLHACNVLLSVQVLTVPRAEANDRVTLEPIGHGFWRMTLRFGFVEDPHVPKALKALKLVEPDFNPMATTFFASREALVASKGDGMALWRDKLFLLLSRNATPATEFFSIPGNQLVELGMQVRI